MNTQRLIKLANELADCTFNHPATTPSMHRQVKGFIADVQQAVDTLPVIDVTSELSIEDAQYEALRNDVCLTLTRTQTCGLQTYMDNNDIDHNDFRMSRDGKLNNVWMA